MSGKENLEKVETASPDIAVENIEKLREIFPGVFAEGKIDFRQLKALLGDFADDRPDRYQFTWAGKKDALRLLQTPSRATLKPAREESVNFDDTGNIFIEGDNLEALKLLYRSYYGRVKMIYIDPPYNTGNDFIYPDNYSDPLDTYLKLSGQKDSNGNLLTSNPNTNGHYHSKWLSMMYPRLFLARQLLREDGVIFISIDDNEVHNLRMVMNEIFGEESFIASFIWKSRRNVDSRNKTGISIDHEYILCYGKKIRGKEIDLQKYSNPDNDYRGDWMSDNLLGLATKENRPNLHYDLINPLTGINYGCPEKGWRYSKKTMAKKISENRIIWPPQPDGRPRHKKFLNEIQNEFTGFSSLLDVPNTNAGTQEIKDLFGADIFSFPKPNDLVKTLIKQGSHDDDIVLDFFAGSGVTAQAILESNREDIGDRQFILVQLPERTDNPNYTTISDIAKERIRRVIKKIKNEKSSELDFNDRETPEDLGFKVFKLTESNFRQWESPPPDIAPDEYINQMELFIDPLPEQWNPEDVIYEVALKQGYSLNFRIEKREEITGAVIYRVIDGEKGQSFRICLDDHFTMDTAKALKLKKDDLFICRDVSLDDTTAANLALQCRLKTL